MPSRPPQVAIRFDRHCILVLSVQERGQTNVELEMGGQPMRFDVETVEYVEHRHGLFVQGITDAKTEFSPLQSHFPDDR